MTTPVVLFKSGVSANNQVIDRDAVVNEIFPSLQRRAERGVLIGEVGQPEISAPSQQNLFAPANQKFDRYTTIDHSRVGFGVQEVSLMELPDGEVAVLGNITPTGCQAELMRQNMGNMHFVPRPLFHQETNNDGEAFLVMDRVITIDAVPLFGN